MATYPSQTPLDTVFNNVTSENEVADHRRILLGDEPDNDSDSKKEEKQEEADVILPALITPESDRTGSLFVTVSEYESGTWQADEFERW
jgi:hypothetical protein